MTEENCQKCGAIIQKSTYCTNCGTYFCGDCGYIRDKFDDNIKKVPEQYMFRAVLVYRKKIILLRQAIELPSFMIAEEQLCGILRTEMLDDPDYYVDIEAYVYNAKNGVFIRYEFPFRPSLNGAGGWNIKELDDKRAG